MSDEINSGTSIASTAVLLPLKNGVIVSVEQLTPVILRKINDVASERWPLPDEKDYEAVVDEVGGRPLLPGTTSTIEAKKNPDYVRDYVACAQARAAYLLDVILRLSVSAQNQDQIVEHHRTRLDIARSEGLLDEHEGDTEWMLVLRHFLATEDDFNNITACAQRKLPLTEGEIAESRKYFRLADTQPTRESVARDKPTSRVNGKAQHSEKQLQT